MTLATLNGYYATNIQDALDNFKDTMVSAGWTLHDDLSGGSPYGYVMASTGEDSDQMSCYLYMYEGTNCIIVLVYSYWDNSTHAGTYYFGNATYSNLDGNNSGSFYIWCSATKSDVALCSYYSSEYDAVWVGEMSPLITAANGTLQSGVSAGSNVVLTLGSGETANFKIGKTYQIVGQSNRQAAVVSAINAGSDQITVSSLSYSFLAGARIGVLPHRWAMTATDTSNFGYNFRTNTNGSANETTQSITADILDTGYANPDNRNEQKYILWPQVLKETSTTGHVGIQKNGSIFLRGYIGATSLHTMSISDADTGTSSGSNSSTTLNDTSKSWTTNEYAGYALIITGGTGAGQFASISSNTDTQLTISGTFTTTPDATSTYTICDEGWLYFYFNASVSQSGAIRMV
jgi:hypothetical protein